MLWRGEIMGGHKISFKIEGREELGLLMKTVS